MIIQRHDSTSTLCIYNDCVLISLLNKVLKHVIDLTINKPYKQHIYLLFFSLLILFGHVNILQSTLYVVMFHNLHGKNCPLIVTNDATALT